MTPVAAQVTKDGFRESIIIRFRENSRGTGMIAPAARCVQEKREETGAAGIPLSAGTPGTAPWLAAGGSTQDSLIDVLERSGGPSTGPRGAAFDHAMHPASGT